MSLRPDLPIREGIRPSPSAVQHDHSKAWVEDAGPAGKVRSGADANDAPRQQQAVDQSFPALAHRVAIASVHRSLSNLAVVVTDNRKRPWLGEKGRQK